VQMLLVARSRRMCCSRVAALAVVVDGFAADAAGQLLQILTVVAAGEESNAGSAKLRRARQRLSFAHGDVRAEGAGRLDHGQRVGLAHRGDQQRAFVVRQLGERRQIRQGTVKPRVAHDHGRDFIAQRLRDGGTVGGAVRAHRDLVRRHVAATGQVGARGEAVVGVHATAEQQLAALGQAAGHQRRFGGRARAVVQARVGQRQTVKLADDGLKLPDRLQRALGDLGLVRRVRRVELAA
jgi:hypothetical protein